ncbi:MAG: HlyD family efflux transporter periplasmic adaptor subunit [Campylobacterales bacterium]|nr:HlyD family efflux transporter periplasmic adaptor subunit [Campylobacterales bacterium]
MSKYFLIVLIIVTLGGCYKKGEGEVKFYGNIDVRTVSLAFEVGGKINAVNFDEGQKVKKGDTIATIDDALYKEYLNQINAQVEMQKAQLQKLEKGYRAEEIEKAKATMEQKKVLLQNDKNAYLRYDKLYRSNSISQEKFDDVKTAYESSNALYMFAKNSYELLQNGYEKEDILGAKAQLDSLMAQKNQSKIRLDNTTLYAPANGTLLSRIYEVGSIVNPSQVVVEIAKEDEYWVRSYISEKYLGLIKQGMKALVYTDGGQSYEGVVSFISPLAEFTPKSVQTEDLRTDLVYRFRIILNAHDDRIKQGMPVTIKFPELKSDKK